MDQRARAPHAAHPVQLPIESNPAVINAYIEKLGWPTTLYKAYDVLAMEEWATDMIPRPCIGVMMLFPIKEAVSGGGCAARRRRRAPRPRLA